MFARSLAILLSLGFLLPAAGKTSAQTVDPTALMEQLDVLPTPLLEELFVFVAGNTLFTLYHESGHMLISELGIPVLGQEEDAVDNLATVTMLADDSPEMDLFLTNAMIGWFLISDSDEEEPVFYGVHDLNPQRGYRILCLMVGADEEAFLDLARDLGLPDERIETCALDYEQAAASWETVTDPHYRDNGVPGGKIRSVYRAAPAPLEPFAVFLRESALMEEVAGQFDMDYTLPRTVTFEATACGVENAFWDADTRTMTLCYELLAAFAGLYLKTLSDDS